MTRVSAFSSPLLLGFDEVERALERLSKATGDGYPPYNIERLPRTDRRGDILRITLAVAGFSDIEMMVASTGCVLANEAAAAASSGSSG